MIIKYVCYWLPDILLIHGVVAITIRQVAVVYWVYRSV